ncbi:MAG: radical SAM protein [Chloroflexi bacterium]|nr:radical SAM protein [Chloroflexota bacterium]
MYSTIYGLIAEHGVDPIEKKPVRCYRPGTKVLSLGTFGCNLRCSWCQNWEIAYVDASAPIRARRYSPAEVVAIAQASGCDGIAWTYNEPSIWVDFIADCAEAAHAAGLYTALISNGLFSPDAIHALHPLIDVYRADFKSLDAAMYREQGHLSSHQGVLDNIIAMHRAGVHVELVTVVMPTYITGEHLARMADWIIRELDVMTPWHLTRFVPYAQLTHLPPTPRAALDEAGAIAAAAGLRRVFIGDWYESTQHEPESVV